MVIASCTPKSSAKATIKHTATKSIQLSLLAGQEDVEIGSANRIRQTRSENSGQKKQEVESLSQGTGMLMSACGTVCSKQDPASAANMG